MQRTTAKTMLLLGLLAPAVRAEDAKPLLGGNLSDVLGVGGPVMYLILAGSIVGLALAFERLVNLRRRKLVPSELEAAIQRATSSSDWKGVDSALKDEVGPLARILAEGLKRRDHGADEVERAMEAVGGHEVARLKRPVRPLAVLSTVMPLLGLLGTIFGMIATFNQLGGTSPADRVKMLAPGIGQALYTTAAGLCVAIPFVVLYHLLIGRVNRAAEQWSNLGSSLVLALRNGKQGGGAA